MSLFAYYVEIGTKMAKIAQIVWPLCESCMKAWRSVWIQHVVAKMVQMIPPASKKWVMSVTVPQTHKDNLVVISLMPYREKFKIANVSAIYVSL